MPDYFGTYPYVNCFEYLDFYARAYGLMGAERNRALHHVMSFTGLDKLAQKPIRGLSKGMRQRLCLGRSMIHDPTVLILDEPAAGLDPRARIELREMIRELAANGKTILVSSHILTELAEMCDLVGIIEQGELLAVGSVDEIQRRAGHQREVVVRVLHTAKPILEWMQQQMPELQARVDGELLKFAHAGERADEAVMLRRFVEAGFEVAEFRSENKSLEDVFMHVTAGKVQ